MQKIMITIAALALSMASATAQVRLVIDTDGVQSSTAQISTATTDLAGKLAAKWRKERRDLTPSEQDNILRGAETLVANRYLTLPATEDSATVHLCLAAQPIGLLVIAKGDETLGAAYVNESGGVEFDIPSDNEEAAQTVTSQLREGGRYVICGIDQPYKLFHNEGDNIYATDITTGKTAAYDTTTLPYYVFSGSHPHHTAAVVGSVIGGIVTLGVIALVAIL